MREENLHSQSVAAQGPRDKGPEQNGSHGRNQVKPAATTERDPQSGGLA
jgi:hypothetical protein